MKSDDDVEKLFSWLQTPDIRYREFAGAREVTDVLLARQTQSDTAEGSGSAHGVHPVHEEGPGHGDPVAHGEPVAPPAPPHSEPTQAAPADAAPSEPKPTDQAGRPLDTVFTRLAGGRGGDRDPSKSRPG